MHMRYATVTMRLLNPVHYLSQDQQQNPFACRPRVRATDCCSMNPCLKHNLQSVAGFETFSRKMLAAQP